MNTNNGADKKKKRTQIMENSASMKIPYFKKINMLIDLKHMKNMILHP